MISTPPPPPATVTVQAGQTLGEIAQAHGVSLQAIEASNPTVSPSHIYVGESITIPGQQRSFTVTLTCTETVYASGNASLNDCSTAPQVSPETKPQTPTTQPNSQPEGSPQSGGDSDLSDVPGVPTAFAACVAYRESSDGANAAFNGGDYGIITASGIDVNGASLAAQKAAFAQLWKSYGATPWDADGCPAHLGYDHNWSADESSNSGPWGP